MKSKERLRSVRKVRYKVKGEMQERKRERQRGNSDKRRKNN